MNPQLLALLSHALLSSALLAQIQATTTNISTKIEMFAGNVLTQSQQLPSGPVGDVSILSLGSSAPGTSGASRYILPYIDIPGGASLRMQGQVNASPNLDPVCNCIQDSVRLHSKLRLTLSSPTLVSAEVSFLCANSPSGVSLKIDLGGDGTTEVTHGSPPVTRLPIQFGPGTFAIDVVLDLRADSAVPVARSLVLFGVTPRIVLTSSPEIVVPSGEPLSQPIRVHLAEQRAGVPMVGSTIQLSATGPLSLSASSTVTDQNGDATVNATALTPGGSGSVVIQGSDSTLRVPVFVRQLAVTRTTNSIDVAVTNAPVNAPGGVPMVLAISPAGITPLATFLGPICTNPLDPATFVFEDGLGLFGSVSLSGQGSTGAPDLLRSYSLPPGVLSGITVWVQGVGFDPDRGLFRTNCEQQTL